VLGRRAGSDTRSVSICARILCKYSAVCRLLRKQAHVAAGYPQLQCSEPLAMVGLAKMQNDLLAGADFVCRAGTVRCLLVEAVECRCQCTTSFAPSWLCTEGADACAPRHAGRCSPIACCLAKLPMAPGILSFVRCMPLACVFGCCACNIWLIRCKTMAWQHAGIAAGQCSCCH
jgi:hypothetical protein